MPYRVSTGRIAQLLAQKAGDAGESERSPLHSDGYRLPLADKYFGSVRARAKIGTIRWTRDRELDIPEGAYCVLFSRATGASLEVEVKRVWRKQFGELGPEEAQLENHQYPPSPNELKTELKAYYPTIKDDDTVTMVEFRYLRDLTRAVPNRQVPPPRR